MITQERVLEIYARANPAPSGEDRDSGAPETTVYLATLQERKTDMQTIEKTDTQTPNPNGGLGRWLVAAIIIAVLATVGIVMATMNDEPPVATSPEVEEPEPVPTSAPEAVVEPEPTTPSTVPETTIPEDPLGATGLPIFSGQSEPGDYEVANANESIVFTSDGEWKCRQLCEPLFGEIELGTRRVLGGYVVMNTLGMSVEAARATLDANEYLILGESETVQPSHPDAAWTGIRFSIEISADAPLGPGCSNSPGYDAAYGNYPCTAFPFGGLEELVFIGPQEMYVLTKPNGGTVFITNYWFPGPQPAETDMLTVNEHLDQLVPTIRFVD